MTDDQLAHLSVLTGLNKMMKGSHFSISTIRTAIETLRCVPDSRAMQILEPLHCVNWADMPAEIRDAVPGLIERCLKVPAYQFKVSHGAAATVLRVA